MALPQANPIGAMTPQMQQYQAFTMKEAISTAMTAAKYQFTSNLISKSPILRNIPGSGILRERAELKKRELYEKQGRDETGRKLTKSEFEERQKRKQDVGKLAEIKDILQSFLDSGVGVFTVKNPKGKMDSGGQMVVSSSGGGAYAIEGEEQAEEREREDDQDQLESEGRQQKFFTRLFGGGDREEGDSSGIMGTLLGWLGSLGSLFTGGLTGFLRLLVGPILSVLGTLMSSVLGYIGPLLTAVSPILIAALPVIIAGLLAGTAGTVIAGWINKQTKKMEDAGKARMGQGFKAVYEVTDKTGKKSLKTAEELGTTDFKMVEEAKDGIYTTKTGQKIDVSRRINMLTQDGKITDRLFDVNTPQAIEAYRNIKGLQFGRATKEILSAESNQQYLKQAPWLVNELKTLQNEMSEYTDMFAADAQNMDDPTTGKKLADKWNLVRGHIKSILSKAEQESGQPGKSMVKPITGMLLDTLTNQYGPFEDIYSKEEGLVNDVARYQPGGFMTSARLRFPSVDSGRLKQKQWWEGSRSHEMATAFDHNRFSSSSYLDEAPLLNPETASPKNSGTSFAIPAASDENAALKTSVGNQPVSINTSASSSTTTNNAVVANAPSAQKTGADQTPKFNGSN